jgi:hypothetical protein
VGLESFQRGAQVDVGAVEDDGEEGVCGAAVLDHLPGKEHGVDNVLLLDVLDGLGGEVPQQFPATTVPAGVPPEKKASTKPFKRECIKCFFFFNKISVVVLSTRAVLRAILAVAK